MERSLAPSQKRSEMRIGFPLKGGSFVDVKEKSSQPEFDTRENYWKIILKADYDGTFSSEVKLLTRKNKSLHGAI